MILDASRAGSGSGRFTSAALAWQWIFWLNVPIGVALIPLASRYMAESHGPRAPYDVAGLTLSGAGLLALMWGLVRANAAGWGSPQVYGPLTAGTVLIAAFAARERRAEAPTCVDGAGRLIGVAGTKPLRASLRKLRQAEWLGEPPQLRREAGPDPRPRRECPR